MKEFEIYEEKKCLLEGSDACDYCKILCPNNPPHDDFALLS